MDSNKDEIIQPFQNQNDINLTDDLCSDSSSQSKIINKDVFIYSWGKNKYGELGLNNAKNTFIPSPVKTLKNSIIKSVKSGGRNTIILTSDEQVLMCGSNIFNLLATNIKFQSNEQYQKIFKSIKFFEENNEKIKEIAIAEFHSLALNINGEIFGWGGNLFNKLGQTNGLCGLPSKIYIKRKIISISCGDYHSCALSENGVLYSWGGGGESYNKGQCGHGSKKDVEQPKKIEFFTKKGLRIIKVSCGGYHTIVMDENYELYGFGKGIFGQCGYGIPEDTDSPKKIIFNDDKISKNLYKIIDIKCGGEHTLFLSNNGKVYACGHGYYGQLGLGNNKNVKSPILVQSLSNKNIIEIASGWSHSLVLTDEGYAYSAGCGKFGELGIGENKNRYNFTWIRKLGKMNVKHIFAGGHHSWCLIDDKYPLKDKFVEPEPLEKANYTMTKRKLSGISDKNNLSFDNNNYNKRNKSSNIIDRKNQYNDENSFDNYSNRNKSFDKNKNNINIFHNPELKKMIEDYNDEQNNSYNNIDNLIDCFDNINSPETKNKKNNNIKNYNNEDENTKKSQISDFNKNKNDNYNTGKDSSHFINEQNNNLSENSLDNKINNVDNMNNLINKKNKNKNYYNDIIMNDDDNNDNNNFNQVNTNKEEVINNNLNDDNDNNDINMDNNMNNINNNKKNQYYNEDIDDNNNNNINNDYYDNNNKNNNNLNEDDYINKNINNNDIINNSNNSNNPINKKLNQNSNKNIKDYRDNNRNDNYNENDINNNINDFDNDYINRNNDIYNKNNIQNKSNIPYNNKNNYMNNNNYNKYNSNSSHGNNTSYRNENNSNIKINHSNYSKDQNRKSYNNNYNNSSKGNFQKNNMYSSKNNDSLLYLQYLNQNKIQLQVIYSELNLSHRFIRFEISNTNKYYKLDFQSINNMIKKYLSFDKGNINFKLQDDREVFKDDKKVINPMMDNLLKEMRNTGLFNTENKNKISYTLAIIYDYNKNDVYRQLFEEFKENYNPKDNNIINFRIINENEILNEPEGLENVLSKWTFDFYEQFKELFIYYEDDINNNFGMSNEKIYRPRFLEMRPKIFK